MRRYVILSLICLPLLYFGGCPGGGPDPLRASGDLGAGGGTVALGGAEVEAPAGALPSTVAVELVEDGPGETVERDAGETGISHIWTLKHDQNAVLNSAGEPFLVRLPFDPAGVGKAEASEAEVFVKMDTGEEIYTLVGTIEGSSIEIMLYGLPRDVNLQVVYNPGCVFLLGDDGEGSPKRLTGLRPWEATRWVLHVDASAQAIRTAVATVLSKDVADVTHEDVVQVVRDRIGRNAREVSELYQTMDLRQPNLEVRTREDGQKRLVINLSNQRNFFENPTVEDGVGQLHISCPALAWAADYWLGTVRGVIAHELFHACVSGYDLKIGGGAFRGYNEGMATVIGHTVDKGGVVSVRPNGTKIYTMMLNQPLGIHDPRRTSYTNNDFFAYVAKRYGGGTVNFFAGTARAGGSDNDGVLEEMRMLLTEETSLLPWGSPLNSYLVAYRKGLHNTLATSFTESLSDVYWDFARNRAYENNIESRLRAGDSTTPFELRTERFEGAGTFAWTFTGDSQHKDLTAGTVPALNAIPPFATRAIVFNGSGFDATLSLAFTANSWVPDELGNSLRVKIYRAGQDGAELDLDVPLEDLGGFGTDFTQVVVLISNVALDKTYSLDIVAETEPNEEPGPCTPDTPTDTWHIDRDWDCDDTWDSDGLWHFETGGTIRDHWLGVISDYSWSVVDNKMIISFGPNQEDGGMEATFSEDCTELENGTYFGGINENCWKAQKW